MLGYTPPPAATAADGTHPTGMHSCYYLAVSQCFHMTSVLDAFKFFVVSFPILGPTAVARSVCDLCREKPSEDDVFIRTIVKGP